MMRKDRFFKLFIDAIKDPEREFTERVYLALSLVSEVCVFLAFVGDIITKESIFEIMAIGITLVMVPVVSYFSLRFNRVDFAIKFTVISLVVAIIPALFFFGGGVEGGGVLWIIFQT